jgi:hypothetical protein
MYALLQLVSFALSGYGVYGIWRGSVWAKDGFQMRQIRRYEEPITFWLIALTYMLIGQLMFWGMRYHLSLL